jgi:hypothetical protein
MAKLEDVPVKSGLEGIEEQNAKMKVKADKVRAFDWDKIQTVDDLKKVVKALSLYILGDD